MACMQRKEDEEVVDKCWVEEELPDELLSYTFELLPKDMVAIAARTCKRWYSCCPEQLRSKLSVSGACSSMSLLRWSLQNGYRLGENSSVAAAANGQLEVLRWLFSWPYCPYDATLVCFAAATHGHLKVLKWLRQRHICRKNTSTGWMAEAARHGHLEILQWARAEGFPWPSQHGLPLCAIAAASRGHLEVLKWLRRNRCPWDHWTCHQAAAGGHLEVLQWAVENGCPWDKASCHNVAVLRGHTEVARWLG
ncbi:Ankyrin repeat-containing domain [Balamuthia mandrillaris]